MGNKLIKISQIIKETCKQNKGFNEDLLRILVFNDVRDENKFYGCIKAEVSGVYSVVNSEKTKVLVEIDRWIHAIVDETVVPDGLEKVKKEASKLKSLSPALYDLYRLEHYDALRRTLRMLLFFKALIGASQNPSIQKPSLVSKELFDESKRIVNGCSALKKALEDLFCKKDELQINNIDSIKFFISLPLLMVISIAMSQCEFFRPIIWEAYSALRAREELESKWPEFENKYINIIAFFIRYQTASGQLARHTGDDKFKWKVNKMLNLKKPLLPFDEKIILDALNLISIVEEARNHKLPGYDGIGAKDDNTADEKCILNEKITRLNLNQDINRNWGEPTWYMLEDDSGLSDIPVDQQNKIGKSVYRDIKHLREDLAEASKDIDIEYILKNVKVGPIRNAERIFSGHNEGLECTWGYFTTMKLHPEVMEKFDEMSIKIAKYQFNLKYNKSKHEKKPKDSRKKDKKNKLSKEIVAFSFGRQQSQDLKDTLCYFIEKVVEEKNAFKYKECFKLRFHPIPDCVDYKSLKHSEEYLVEILLDDVRAAQKLLFDKPVIIENNAKQKITKSEAVDLFLHLYEHSLDLFELRGDVAKLSDKKGSFYMPFPLLKRLLDIVYRLRPRGCFAIPVTFDDRYPHAIHIPNNFDKEKDMAEIDVIANFVNAYVLNHGMARGFKKCDLGLGVLVDENNHKSNTTIMTPAKWKDRIEEYFEGNGYDVLTEKYLRDFNTERLNVEKVSSYRPSMLLPTELDQLNRTLCEYFTANKSQINNIDEIIFLGIDVGGTLIKFQFYKFTESAGFEELGDQFRIKTSSQARISNSLIKSAHEFTYRIIKRIKDQIDIVKIEADNILAVGISWPGPVRNNRIAGTSGILKNFPPLQNIIKNNKIEDIMALEIVDAFKTKWREIFKKEGKKETQKEKKKKNNPFIFLVNDGDADGSGALEYFRSRKKGEEGVDTEKTNAKESLVVIKLGTGTAGAVFVNGRKEPGLNEWGKIVLDLATEVDKNNPNGYPKGVVNPYLSAKTIPTLFARLQDYDPQEREIDSIELDLALRTIHDKKNNKELQNEFIEECGIRQVAKELNDKFDIEQIRTALRKKTQSEEDKIIKNKSLKLLHKDLKSAVRDGGKFRRGNLLPTNPSEKEQMKEYIERSANAMGNYIGDFVVLLYDMYQVEQTLKVLFGGGVLSGKIGNMAIEKARERVKKYNLDTILDGHLMTVKPIEKDSKESKCKNSSEEGGKKIKKTEEKKNFSTRGAAISAAISFLFENKEEGLQIIEQKLLHLKPNDSIRIDTKNEDAKVEFIIDNEKDSSITLKEYTLKGEDVENYLLTYGKDLGFYTLSIPGEFREYTRW